MIKLTDEIRSVMQPADAIQQALRPAPMATLSSAAQRLLTLEDEAVDEEGYAIPATHLLPAIEAFVWCASTYFFFKDEKALVKALRFGDLCYMQGRQDALKGGGG